MMRGAIKMSDYRQGQGDLNEKKLNQMKVAILKAGQDNLKTREKPNDEMVDFLRKIIVEEVKKAY
jgi:hypothetical protein